MKINILSDPIVKGKKIGVHFWIDIQNKANDKFFNALAERTGDKERYLRCSNPNCKEKQFKRVFIDNEGKFYCEVCYRDGLDLGILKPALPQIG